jgi:hypothetical protein
MFAAGKKYFLSRRKWLLGFGILLFAFSASIANADIFATDPSYLPNQHGEIAINGNVYDNETNEFIYHSFAADVEYAVYYQNAFGQSFPNRYIYTYQFFNHAGPDPDYGMNPNSIFSSDGINDFGVGVAGNIDLIDMGYFADQHPAYTSIAPTGLPDRSPGAGSIHWRLTSPMVNYSQQSEILYFTSENAPGVSSGTLVGGATIDVNGLPTPAPEPVTGVSIIMGAVVLFIASAIRKIRGIS